MTHVFVNLERSGKLREKKEKETQEYKDPQTKRLENTPTKQEDFSDRNDLSVLPF